jgi:hypothetical protein
MPRLWSASWHSSIRTPRPRRAARKLRRFVGLRRNYPHVYANLLPSRESLANFIRRRGLPIDPVTGLPSHRIVSVNRPEVHEAVNTFGIKLACALHYRETGRIVPASGAISVRWYSNVQLVDGAVPAAVLEINGAPHRGLVRANRILNRQFMYSAAIPEERDSGIYIATFRRSFALQMAVVCERGAYADLDYSDWKEPFRHSA